MGKYRFRAPTQAQMAALAAENRKRYEQFARAISLEEIASMAPENRGVTLMWRGFVAQSEAEVELVASLQGTISFGPLWQAISEPLREKWEQEQLRRRSENRLTLEGEKGDIDGE